MAMERGRPGDSKRHAAVPGRVPGRVPLGTGVTTSKGDTAATADPRRGSRCNGLIQLPILRRSCRRGIPSMSARPSNTFLDTPSPSSAWGRRRRGRKTAAFVARRRARSGHIWRAVQSASRPWDPAPKNSFSGGTTPMRGMASWHVVWDIKITEKKGHPRLQVLIRTVPCICTSQNSYSWGEP